MRENLPKEMDFAHEASNAARAALDFRDMETSLYIPEVITATKRVLIMEYIRGGRVDDLAYLAKHNIDRNKVALELSRIFNQMVFVNGWFHAGRFLFIPGHFNSYACHLLLDPHPGIDHAHLLTLQLLTSSPLLGNLLIRPAPRSSRSPYNFEIVLLDHGLYFDLDTQLRINYSKLWLSLIATNSSSVNADRRKYAELVGNIGPDLVSFLAL